MFDPDAAALIEGGSVLIVGTVAPDGSPVAARGWAAHIVEPGPPARVRLLVSETDTRAIANLEATPRVAVTAADVRTLRSLQLKGVVTSVEPADRADLARAERYLDAVFTAIVDADGARHEVLTRWIPVGYVACTIEVTERFDQTPGPGAGAPLPSVTS